MELRGEHLRGLGRLRKGCGWYGSGVIARKEALLSIKIVNCVSCVVEGKSRQLSILTPTLAGRGSWLGQTQFWKICEGFGHIIKTLVISIGLMQ